MRSLRRWRAKNNRIASSFSKMNFSTDMVGTAGDGDVGIGMAVGLSAIVEIAVDFVA